MDSCSQRHTQQQSSVHLVLAIILAVSDAIQQTKEEGHCHAVAKLGLVMGGDPDRNGALPLVGVVEAWCDLQASSHVRLNSLHGSQCRALYALLQVVTRDT